MTNMKNTIKITLLFFCAIALIGCDSAPFVGSFNFKPVDGSHWRSGQPTTEADFVTAVKAGACQVLKLDDENLEFEKTICVKYHLKLIYVPITALEQLNGVPKWKIDAIRSAMQLYGTWVHCKNGWDRTGLAVGMYRVDVRGCSPEYAYRDMLANGFHPILKGLYGAWQDFSILKLKADLVPQPDMFHGKPGPEASPIDVTHASNVAGRRAAFSGVLDEGDDYFLGWASQFCGSWSNSITGDYEFCFPPPRTTITLAIGPIDDITKQLLMAGAPLTMSHTTDLNKPWRPLLLWNPYPAKNMTKAAIVTNDTVTIPLTNKADFFRLAFQ